MNEPTKSMQDLKPQPPKDISQLSPKQKVAHHIQSKSAELAKLLPKHLNADRLLKVALVTATSTPALAECDVASLVYAIGQCAQLGLEPNTVLGHAYLVPFNTKRGDVWVKSVQVIIGYKGLIDLARRSGQIVSIAAHEVCEKDVFEYEYGLREKLKHIPATGNRGAVTHFYAVAKLVGGGYAFEVMSVDQVMAVRAESQGYQQAVKYKKNAAHPWEKHFIEMGRKTAIRRIAKYLPLSIEFQRASEMDGKAPDTSSLVDYSKVVDGEMNWIDDSEAQGDPLDTSDSPYKQAAERQPGSDDEGAK